MPLPDQQPSEEFSERFGETGAGLLVMPQMVAVDDYKRNQAAARRRVNEAHEMHKAALGMSDIGKKAGGDSAAESDDMGDMIYTGDITLHPGQKVKLGKNTTIEAEHEKPEPSTPAAPDKPAKPIDKAKSWWPAIAVGAALLGPGLGFLAAHFTKPTTAPVAGVDTDTDTIVEMDFP